MRQGHNEGPKATYVCAAWPRVCLWNIQHKAHSESYCISDPRLIIAGTGMGIWSIYIEVPVEYSGSSPLHRQANARIPSKGKHSPNCIRGHQPHHSTGKATTKDRDKTNMGNCMRSTHGRRKAPFSRDQTMTL